MMIKSLVGVILGLMIGAGCRWFDVPVPSPPKLIGAVLVVAITVGYNATDKLINDKVSKPATITEVRNEPPPAH